MKNKTKKILFSILGAVILVVGSFGVFAAIKYTNGDLNGTVVTNVQEGYGQDEWRQYDVDIPFNGTYSDKLYTNEPGDYIYNISYSYNRVGVVKITYDNYFNIADNFQAFFVLSNMKEGSELRYYQTEVETTYWLLGDYIDLPISDLDPNFDNTRSYEEIKKYHVIEVWIRTLDD